MSKVLTEREEFRKHYDNEAENYDRNRDLRNALTIYNSEQQISWVRNKLEGGDKKILECGCGTGKFLIPLSNIGLNIEAIDYSKEMIRVCKNKADGLGLQLNIKTASVEALPFRDGEYDAVFSIAVIRHFEDSATAISEMGRVLKADGDLIIDFLNLDYFKPYHKLLSICGLDGNVKSGNFYKNYYLRRREVSELLEQQGFEIIEIKYFVQLPPRKALGWLIPLLRVVSKVSNFGAVGFVHARKKA